MTAREIQPIRMTSRLAGDVRLGENEVFKDFRALPTAADETSEGVPAIPGQRQPAPIESTPDKSEGSDPKDPTPWDAPSVDHPSQTDAPVVQVVDPLDNIQTRLGD